MAIGEECRRGHGTSGISKSRVSGLCEEVDGNGKPSSSGLVLVRWPSRGCGVAAPWTRL